MKEILRSKVVQKFLIVVFMILLFIGVGRILLDVFKKPIDYQNFLSALCLFLGILSYINKVS